MMPNVELVYFQGCPHVPEARRRLRQALELCQLDASWQEWDIGAGTAPSAVMGYGSPTVLIDGRDVLGDRGQGAGLGCAVGGAPAVEAIVAALRGGRS